MNQNRGHDITQLLAAHKAGDVTAFDRLFPLVYQQLKAMAHVRTGQGQGTPTLNTTALVHEAYEKLVRQEDLAWEDRGHFFAVAARAMRQIVVDYARERTARKRGGGKTRVTLNENTAVVETQAGRLLDLERALEKLAGENERLVRLIECRFFTGLTEAEAAQTLNVSTRTVQRDWTKARAWLALHDVAVTT